jgi:4-hydroxybenzoate polyprenyltransferase
MRIITAFFRLIRWPNLVLFSLTQLLFEYCIYQKVYNIETVNRVEQQQFILLVLSLALIYAGGYIINDYFDINIDQINKPGKVIVFELISRRWVIFWHMFLSLLGFFLTIYAVPIAEYWHLILGNLITILLLWFYSTNFKKKLLIGNVIISLLTAWSIGLIFLSKFPVSMNDFITTDLSKTRFSRYAILYISFAFIISLIREVIKDMEDIEGDRKYGCRTMPIVWGINASKVFVTVWIIVLVAILVVLQFYVLPFGWWHLVLYCLCLIIAPLIWIINKLFKAQSSKDFHLLSSVVKWVMLTGIISMFFFQIYL